MPFFRYCSATLAMPSLKMTTLCHSVFSLRSPEFLSRQLSDVAMRMLTTGSPEFRRRISGSAPRLPTRMTLLTLPAMIFLRAIRNKFLSQHLTGYARQPLAKAGFSHNVFVPFSFLYAPPPIVKEWQQCPSDAYGSQNTACQIDKYRLMLSS